MIAQDLALALDPALLAERVGLTLDPWQADVLRSTEQQVILNITRQGGKSTATSLLALHAALYQAPALVLLLAPALRQAQELFRKVRDSYEALGRPVPTIGDSALTLEFVNGSRIVALPGSEKTIRGYSGAALLVVDEASRVPDELYQAVRPMLAVSGGRVVLLSTPWGKRGFFHHEWTEGRGWKRVEVTAHDCPRISHQWLEAERMAIGDWWFMQEYLCQFVETEDTVFSYDDVEAAMRPGVPFFEGGIF